MSFDSHIATFKYAFPKTLPILAGFTFLGISYGIYMNTLGFGPVYAIRCRVCFSDHSVL